MCVGSKTIVLEGCISQYVRLLYWRDASHNTLDYCIGGMHLTQYITIVLLPSLLLWCLIN